MISVSTYINDEPVYLQARDNYVNNSIDAINNKIEFKFTFPYIKFHKCLKDSSDERKEIYEYNDGNITNHFYVIHSAKTSCDQRKNYTSIVYLSDENGESIEQPYICDILIENYGTTLLTTHFATIYDINYEAFGELNHLNDGF